MKYDFKKIEKKWQKKWEQGEVFCTGKDEVKKGAKKFYCLEMFPYASGEGLHIGHALNYTIGDIYARFKRMSGFNVFHPMGYDSFGLPAENAAIKVGMHPKKYTEDAIKNFTKQQKALGWSYDWEKMLSTHWPEYYKWNQFFFLKFLEKGLAYRKKSAANWCPKCRTVLANEQVHNGKCWRHEDTEVEIKHLEQWFLKTTDYADELLDGIDDLQWPDRIKTMQKNWIGKSHGTEIDFEIETASGISNVVIVHGAAFYDKEKLVQGLPPQNERSWIPWLKKELEKKGINCFTPLMPKNWKPNYEEWKKEFERISVDEDSVLIGHSAGGTFLIRWLGETKKKIKKLILVAPAKICPDFYETYFKKFYNFKIDKNVKNNVGDIVIFLSDDSEDIIQSARIYQRELKAELIKLKGRGHFIEKHMGTKEFPELLNEIFTNKKFPVFTTRSDTIYGVTFMVISAQHEKLMELVTNEQKKQVEKFLQEIKSVSLAPKGVPSVKGDLNTEGKKDADKLNKQGVFTGSYAINPMTKEKIPVYAGNFVVAEYGSGMVMGVPAHDQRDFEFAKKYGLGIKRVVRPKIARYCIIEKSLPREKVKELNGFGKIEIEKEIASWGKFIIVYPDENKEEKLVKFLKKNLLKKSKEAVGWYSNSGDLVIFNNKVISFSSTQGLEEFKKYGKSLGIPERQLDLNVDCYINSGKLINSEKFNGLDNEKAKQEITKYLIKNKLGRSSVQYKLRDWLISRQRYWGTPIPVVYCDKCGIVAVDEKDLPVILPEKVKFGKGNPLETNKNFVKVKCPKCNGQAQRETDTMDTFFDSSWYFMRYPDNKNKKSAFDKKKINYWLPVDQYVGGAEHACMHLLYARFFTKVLRDMGFVDFDEPFIKLFNQGMLHASDGRKMSKSLGNVINPSDVVQTKGADALRLTLMSFASPDSDTAWDDKVLHGSLKFLTKVYEKFDKIKICTQGCTPNNIQKNIVTKGSKSSAKIESKLNKTIKEVTNQIENFKYNLAVIKIRELFNSLGEEESKDVLEKSLKLLHVFCPHITEELWSKLGNKNFICLEKWPVADEKKIDEKFEKQEQAVEKLKSDIEQIKKLLNKKNPKVYIYVLPNELEIYKDVKGIKIFAVNDKKKYDPENKSKKVKPNRPAIFIE